MASNVTKQYEEMRRAMRAFRHDFGEEIVKAIPLYEDPTRYPVDELISLFKLQMDFRKEGLSEDDKAALKARFAAKRDSIRLLPDAPDRILLWPEGKMPKETVYETNSDFEYDHDPDYQPYYLEMLIPEDQTPLGGIANMNGLLPWLWEKNVPVEIHTFAGHPHGYAGWKIIDGKGDPNFDLWVAHADVFLRDLFIGYDPKLFG